MPIGDELMTNRFAAKMQSALDRLGVFGLLLVGLATAGATAVSG